MKEIRRTLIFENDNTFLLTVFRINFITLPNIEMGKNIHPLLHFKSFEAELE